MFTNLPDVMSKNLLLQSSFLLLVLLCTSCGKSEEDHRLNADALAKVIPILEAEGVTLLMYEDHRKVLGNGRGMFFESDSGKHPFTGDATPFDATATADFDRLWKQIAATQAEFYVVRRIKRGRGGKITQATFSWGGRGYKTAGADQDLYVYSPGYKLPNDMIDRGPYDLRHTRINDDWYYVLKEYD